MTWKQESSKTVYKNKWMEVTEDQVVTDHGKHLVYGVVRKEPAVLIVPWDGQSLYLVGQYRYPVDEYSWEFPQGHYEHGGVLETAREELREETGFTASAIKEVATFNTAPGHHSQKYHMFLATGLVAGESDPEESEEGIVTKNVSFVELQEMVAQGKLLDGPTLAACAIITSKKLFNS